MNVFLMIVQRLRQEIDNALLRIRSIRAPIVRVSLDVPYVCQFAVPESAEPTLKKQLATIDDPNWMESGAASKERYALLAPNICGIASAAMVIGFYTGVTPKPVPLAEDAIKAGVFQETADDLTDMNYRMFAQWIPKYGLRADVYTRLSLSGIRHALSMGLLVIASVNPNIRGFVTSSEQKIGGHMVVVVGYDMDAKTVMINNSSGFTSLQSQKDHTMPTSEFLRYFAGRGIVISSL